MRYFSTFSLSPAAFRLSTIAYVCAITCATTCVGAQAQSTATAQPVASLKEVVVSGNRSERNSEDVPATIDLVTSEQLEKRQINNIRALANETPNVSVRRTPNRASITSANGKEGNAGFNVRGLEGNRVLLLVDGVRAPRNYSFGATSRDNFDFGLVNRVEIVKGPSSALYGSDGIGGLVQFFTKSPSDFLTGDKTIGGQGSVGFSGEDRGLQLGATVAGKPSEAVQWLLSANVSRAKELGNRGDNGVSTTDRTQPNPQKDSNTAILGKLVLRPTSAQKHTFTAELVDKKSDFNDLLSLRSKPPLAATSVLSAKAETDNERQRFTWQGQFKVSTAMADELKASLSYQNFTSREFFANDRNTAADQVRITDDKETTLQANVQGEKLLRGSSVSHKLVYGFDYAGITASNLQTGVTPPVGETFPLKRFPKTKETTTALYLQDELIDAGASNESGGAWSITPAIRFDRYQINAEQAGFGGVAGSQSGSAVSPKLAGMFQINPQWNVYGQWAKGFRAPSADQLNRFFENAVSFYKTIPNPNLKPEKSSNFELGTKARFDQFKIDASIFTGRYSDFILDNQQVGGAGTPGNPIIFQAINIRNATISGFEVKGDYSAGKLGIGRLSFPFAYGQTKGTDKGTGKPLNSVQPEKLNVGVKYDTAAWDLRLDVTRRAAKSAGDADLSGLATQFLAPASTTLDVSGQWRISKDLRLNLAVANLTNKKYWRWSDVQGLASTSPAVDAYTQPGRSLNASLVASF